MSFCLPIPEKRDEETQPLTKKEEDERRIAELGRPMLGEHAKMEVIIEESYEFKVSLPPMSDDLGSSSLLSALKRP